MSSDETKNRSKTGAHHPSYLIYLSLILLFAFGLRVYAFTQNTRAYGDVNTIRISAQHYATIGILQYPWRIDRYEDRLGDPLASPAYQHAPALPIVAGALARVLGNADTFFTLKLITLAVGTILVAVGYKVARRLSAAVGLITVVWLATSPALIDFSGNGSPYIISALAMLIFSGQLERYSFRTRDAALLAVTCSLAFQFHPAMLVLTLSAGLIGLLTIRNLSIGQVLIFAGVWSICYAPSAAWYLTYYGQPFISGQLYFITGELGLVGAQRAAVISNPLNLWIPPLAETYFEVIRLRAEVYLANLNFELSTPMLLSALVAGIIGLLGKNRLFVALIAPRLLYLGLTAAAVSLFHMRFIVPMLPALLIMAAYGVERFSRRGRRGYRLALIFVLLYTAWALVSYFTADTPPTRYYRAEMTDNIEYDAARDITYQLRDAQMATIAGCADARMMLYDTAFRLEATGCQPNPQRIRELLSYQDLNIRYLMYESDVISGLAPYFPEARIIAQNGVFAVLDLMPDPE